MELLIVTAGETGPRIDAWLPQAVPGLTRSAAQRMLENGEITLNGLPVKKNHKLTAGEEFTLTVEDVPGTAQRVSVTYPRLHEEVSPGQEILIDDGLIEMTVEQVDRTNIVCRVINGGVVSNHKGVNVPDVDLSMPYISDKDREDILFGISQDVDFIAASFVQKKEDILQLRRLLEKNGGEDIKIISKIENAQGVANIDDILAVSDGVMVARGDMGVEIPYEDVPVIQKEIIKKVYRAGKQVITATQMLESMIKNPRPTFAWR